MVNFSEWSRSTARHHGAGNRDLRCIIHVVLQTRRQVGNGLQFDDPAFDFGELNIIGRWRVGHDVPPRISYVRTMLIRGQEPVENLCYKTTSELLGEA